jgi:hypothetical protein
MKIFRGILEFVGVIVLLIVSGELFRNYMLIFLIIWVLIPLIVTLLNLLKVHNKLSLIGAKNLRNITTGIVLAISIMLLINYGSFNDLIGYHFISGYHSTYVSDTTDTEDGARPTYAQVVTTKNPRDRDILIYGVDSIILLLCIGLPLLNWRKGNRIYKTKDQSPN